MPHNKWDNNDIIKYHSEIKLEVLENYLKEYFKTLCKHYNREAIKLTYIDGFAGGGMYKDVYNNIVLGSPLRVMDTIGRVQEEINRGRTKPIKFDIKYIFIDNDKQAIDSLKKSIKDLGFDRHQPVVICDKFVNQVDNIILYISKHTPRANSAIFFLDPYGYTDVSLSALQKLSTMKGCEIILNLMTDYIIHYVTYKNNNFIKSMQKIGLGEIEINHLNEAIQNKREDDIIFLRHYICQYLHKLSGFNRASDFSIKQGSSNKFNTLLHLSHHPKSREVMLNTYWNNNCHSITKLHNGVEYNLLYNTDKQAAFNFSKKSKLIMYEQGVKIIHNEINEKGVVFTDDLQDIMAKRYSAFTEYDIQKTIKLDDGLIGLNKNGKETESLNQIKGAKHKKQTSFHFPEN